MEALLGLLAAFRSAKKDTPSSLSEHAPFLDYVERKQDKTLNDLQASFNGHTDRAIKILIPLTAGAGAIAAYAFSNWKNLPQASIAGLLTLAVIWGICAVYTATKGMETFTVDAGSNHEELIEVYQQKCDLNAPANTQQVQDAMSYLRKTELNRQHNRIKSYQAAVNAQTAHLRIALGWAALAPVIAGVISLATYWGFIEALKVLFLAVRSIWLVHP